MIRRAATSHLSAWRCFDRVQTVDVKTAHLYVSGKPSAKLEGESVSFEWETTGTIWTKGTSCIIKRTNLTNPSTYEFVLSEEQFKSGKFKDDLMSLCNVYSYSMELKQTLYYRQKL